MTCSVIVSQSVIFCGSALVLETPTNKIAALRQVILPRRPQETLSGIITLAFSLTPGRVLVDRRATSRQDGTMSSRMARGQVRRVSSGSRA